jgi:hypothetical protein
MIYIFTSQAGGRITMTGEVAERILALIDKRPGRQGVITHEEIEPAIRRLERAVADETRVLAAAAQDARVAANDDEADEQERAPEPVSLRQRVFPFLELLQNAARAGKEVTWGL